MIWSNGTIVDDDALVVSVLDRTFEHGLGLFETLRTWNGRPTLLPRHLARMRRAAAELGLPLDPEALPLAEDVQALLDAEGRSGAGDAMLRITLSGGSSSQGAMLWMRAGSLPLPVDEGGATLGTTGPAREDPLTGYKTLNYWPYRLLHERARDEGCDEALLVGPSGAIREGSRTNVFFVADGGLTTPACDGRIVPGVMRALVVERAIAMGIDVVEAPLRALDPRRPPDEVFLTNAVRGIVPVGRWGGSRFPAPGPITTRLWDDVSAWLLCGGGS